MTFSRSGRSFGFLNILAVTSAPPVAKRKVPWWVWLVAPALIIGILALLDFTITMYVLVLGVFLTLLLLHYFMPELFPEVAKFVFFLVFGITLGVVVFLVSGIAALLVIPIMAGVLLKANQWAGLAFVVLVVILGVGMYTSPDSNLLFAPDSLVGQRVADQQASIAELWEKGLTVPDDAVRLAEVQFARATGGVYRSEVDEKAQQNLGVFVPEINIEDYTKDADIWLFASIKGIAGKKQIEVSYGCKINDRVPMEYSHSVQTLFFEPTIGEVEPKDAETHEVYCKFDGAAFEKGAKTVEFNVNYGFRSSSYIEGFFIDSKTKSALKRMDIDLASTYGVVEKPRAQADSGPLRLGMEFLSSNPITINEGQDKLPIILMVSLSPAAGWATPGDIKLIKNFFIVLPKQVTLKNVVPVKIITEGGGEVNFTKISCNDLPLIDQVLCNPQTEQIYLLDLGDLKKKQTVLSLRIIGELPRSEYESFLEGGFTSKIFKTIADYQLQITKKDTFTIR